MARCGASCRRVCTRAMSGGGQRSLTFRTVALMLKTVGTNVHNVRDNLREQASPPARPRRTPDGRGQPIALCRPLFVMRRGA